MLMEAEQSWWELEKDAGKSVCSINQMPKIRELSRFFVDILDVRKSINKKVMREIVDDWHHP